MDIIPPKAHPLQESSTQLLRKEARRREAKRRWWLVGRKDAPSDNQKKDPSNPDGDTICSSSVITRYGIPRLQNHALFMISRLTSCLALKIPQTKVWRLFRSTLPSLLHTWLQPELKLQPNLLDKSLTAPGDHQRGKA
jgi:hypothetical protein